MDRKEFLSLVGMSMGAYVLTRCLESCSKKDGGSFPTPPSNVNMTLTLTDPAYSALGSNGGYVYLSNGIIVARTNSGSYLAVSEYCTHQGTAVVFRASQNNFYCSSHGSVFGADGHVSNGPAGIALKQYNTSLSGNSLTITG